MKDLKYFRGQCDAESADFDFELHSRLVPVSVALSSYRWMYLLLRLSASDAPLLALPVLQLLLDGDQSGLQELQFGGEQLLRFLLGAHSSQLLLLLAERRQAADLLLDLQEHLLHINTHTH